MTIRPATMADVPLIIDMIERLVVAVRGVQRVDRVKTGETLCGLLADPDGAVWVSGEGFLAASLQRTIINPAPIAVEHGWWASDGSGLRLLRIYEAWAEDKGAALITLSTGPFGPDLSRLGYRRAEQAWTREL